MNNQLQFVQTLKICHEWMDLQVRNHLFKKCDISVVV